MIAIGKLAILGLWVWGIAAFIAPESVPYAAVAQIAVAALALVHVVEALAFSKKLARSEGTQGQHAVQLLIFGFLHVLGVGQDKLRD